MTHAPRLRKLAAADLEPGQLALYEAITGPLVQAPLPFQVVDAAGGLEGPFNGYLRQPILGTALMTLGSAVGGGMSLSGRERELAILVVAAHQRCDFMRYAHEAIGLEVGLTEVELEALRGGRLDVFVDEHEQAVARITEQLVSSGDLDDDAYRAAVDALGEAALFELLTLVGFYFTLALQMRVFRVGVPVDS
jgi:4-carboxymuconolactone decarboxylase